MMFPLLMSLWNFFFPEAEAARKTALFGEVQGKKNLEKYFLWLTVTGKK